MELHGAESPSFEMVRSPNNRDFSCNDNPAATCGRGSCTEEIFIGESTWPDLTMLTLGFIQTQLSSVFNESEVYSRDCSLNEIIKTFLTPTLL